MRCHPTSSEVREIFRHLVTSDQTRAVLSRDELLQVLGDGARRAIEKLVVARLLAVTDGEDGARVEIAHEALLTAWPRLVRWTREDADSARMRDQLRAAARQWSDRKRSRGLLWRGPRGLPAIAVRIPDENGAAVIPLALIGGVFFGVVSAVAGWLIFG